MTTENDPKTFISLATNEDMEAHENGLVTFSTLWRQNLSRSKMKKT